QVISPQARQRRGHFRSVNAAPQAWQWRCFSRTPHRVAGGTRRTIRKPSIRLRPPVVSPGPPGVAWAAATDPRMADLLQFLAILDSDPDDVQVLSALADTAHRGIDATGVQALGHAKKTFRDRGRFDVALRLLDVELSAVMGARRADLLIEKGQLL